MDAGARWDDLSRPGDFVPVTVLDEPIVVTHGHDDRLRAFYNVCRHRAGRSALTEATAEALQCKYGWTLWAGRHAADGSRDGGHRGLRSGLLRPQPGACGSVPGRSCSSTSMKTLPPGGRHGRHPGRGGARRLRPGLDAPGVETMSSTATGRSS
ncbi:MAG: Rieske 2Fe-2S domain-containing protein [Chloroflexota bacterium]